MKITFPTHLSDGALVAAVIRLSGCEREATVQLLTHLAELDKRRLYLGAGLSSLYKYCIAVLRLSEHEAYMRMKAARAVRRFPRILEMLLDGSLNLTMLRLLVPHLKSHNHEALLVAASGKSKREVQELLARLFPQPDVPASVRKLPPCRPTVEISIPAALLQLNEGAASAPALPLDATVERPVSAPAPVSPSRQRPLVTPLAPDRYQVTFTASAETRAKLELAQDMLRHAVPNGDPAVIVDRALTALLEELARKKFAATRKPRASRGTVKRSRHVPAEVKRAVWIRDLGRCAFVAPNGRPCAERAFVEFHHHDQPYAVGGLATLANIQLRCRAHNGYEADLYYGPKAPEGEVREIGLPYGSRARQANWVQTQLRSGRATRSSSGCSRWRSTVI